MATMTACARTVPVPVVTSTALRPARMRRTGVRSKNVAPRLTADSAKPRQARNGSNAKPRVRMAAPPIDGRLPRQRGRRHPGVIEARRAPGVILTAQAPDRLRITADDGQQVLRHEVAPDVLPLDRRRQIERRPPLSLPERPGHAQAVRAGRLLKRRVEVLANQSRPTPRCCRRRSDRPRRRPL